MNDLLPLVAGNGAPQPPPPPAAWAGAAGPSDIEMGRSTDTSKGREMDAFFQQVNAIKAELNEIQGQQASIVAQHDRSKTLVRRQEVQQAQADLQRSIDGVKVTALRAKQQLEALERSNQEAMKLKGQERGTANERTRTSITAGLRKKLRDQMGEFTELRARIHEEYREVVERRVYTVTGQHLPEDDIDRMIESGEAENIFQKAILEQGRGRVLDTVAEIEERHEAVKKLEKSLVEMHQIFLDMAVLVEAQGEMLDNIEQQVQRSVDHVQQANVSLVEAKRLQRNTRKWMFCGIATFIILVIILIVALLVYLKPWAN